MDKELRRLDRKRRFWKGAALVLVGAFLGYLIAPTKNGLRFENNGSVGSGGLHTVAKEPGETREGCVKEAEE